MRQCCVRTRAGSEHDRRQSAEPSAQPLLIGAGSTTRQQDDRISVVPGSPAVPASADESAEAEEETAMRQCCVRTRAGSEHNRRQSAELSARPLVVGTDSTARQQNDRISVVPGSPAVPASADESAEAEEETAMRQGGVQTRTGGEHSERLSAEQLSQPRTTGAGSTARQQNNQISGLPGSPATSASADESADAEERITVQQNSRQARAASRQSRLYGNGQPARLAILNAQSLGSRGRMRQERAALTSRTPRGAQWYQGERRRAAAVNQESSDASSD